eukprot:comp24105_c0_seq1/m.43570 comp24105_c0_seq1/g.43570  ORF comp24105_c0_seq1/g.43570 comp24105_c0_seq1/m.43570 type:complete len:621 (-) comp24105_c0_seq1:702-2564(-)
MEKRSPGPGGSGLQQRRGTSVEDGAADSMTASLGDTTLARDPPRPKGAWESLKAMIFAPAGTKFGTWDGVFTSCIVNIFGVILFLRMGYIVGNMGIPQAMGLVLLVYVMSFITILSTAGICNTCHLNKGGVYAIIKQALGTQIGGTIGVIYFFGLATMNAVFVLGFAEAFCDVCGWNSQDIGNLRTVGMVVELLVLGVCLMGVEWIVKLQLFLLLLLMGAIFNFIIGGFITPTFNQFFTSNMSARYDKNTGFFDMLGLFFATTSGIMAGANMSGDLRHPSVSIPVGTIAAISVTNLVYASFILICASVALSAPSQGLSPLGYLKTDYLIAQHVSGSEVLYFIGLFVAAISSAFGVFIGAPRVLQGIGEDVHVPGIEQFAVGWGEQHEPVRATFLVAIITGCFIILGDLNAVAPVMTIVLCVAHGACNYAYFALATGGLREEALARQLEEFGKHTVNVDTRTIEVVNGMAKEHKQVADFRKPPQWVMVLTNRWISLLNCLWHIVLMFLIQWWQGLVVIGVFLVLYVYIGFLNKNDNRLGDADFSLRAWLNPLHHPSRKRQRPKQFAEAELPGQADTNPPLSTANHSNLTSVRTGGESESHVPTSIYAEEIKEGFTPAREQL